MHYHHTKTECGLNCCLIKMVAMHSTTVVVLIISAVINHQVLSQDSGDDIWGDGGDSTQNPSDDGSNIWGSEDSSSQKPSDDGDGIWGGGDGMTMMMMEKPDQEEVCECIPYYLCDLPRPKKDSNSGKKTKRIECPHYILKCCDDEDPVVVELPEPTPKPTQKPTPPPTPEPMTPPQPKGCGYRNNDPSATPTDGSAGFGEFPWVVAIYYNDATGKLIYVCGGALIHPEVVVTAAHCIKEIKKEPKIRAGEWDSRNVDEKYQHQDREVASITIHAQYVSGSFHNDIALMFLKRPVDLAWHVNVVCLPPYNTVVDNAKCISNGWGRESFGKEGVLTKVELPMVPRRQCEQDLRKTRLGRFFTLHRSFVCAGGEAGKDTCKGDGGSPLVCPIPGENDRFYHIGIVSWGIGCGGYRIPGVYVNIPLFRNWIEEKLKKKNIDLSMYQPY